MNTVKFTSKAAKQLKKLQRQDREKVFSACESLASMPDHGHIKALTNHQYDYRLRIGNYRVLFDFYEEIKIVSIEEVKKRDERTY